LKKKIAPIFLGQADKTSLEMEECPICFLNYPGGLNRSNCCKESLCTQCYLQVKPSVTTVTLCPFCNQGPYSITFRGPLTKEEREREEKEQRAVLELEAKMKQDEEQRDREREQKRKTEKAEKAEKEKQQQLEKAKAEAEKQRIENERLQKEKLEKERLDNEEKERIKKEREEQIKKENQEKVELEKRDREALEKKQDNEKKETEKVTVEIIKELDDKDKLIDEVKEKTIHKIIIEDKKDQIEDIPLNVDIEKDTGTQKTIHLEEEEFPISPLPQEFIPIKPTTITEIENKQNLVDNDNLEEIMLAEAIRLSLEDKT